MERNHRKPEALPWGGTERPTDEIAAQNHSRMRVASTYCR